MPSMKYCSKCRALKPLSEYYKRKDGTYPSTCKDCDRERARERYHSRYETKDGRKKILKSRAKYRKAHQEELAEAQRIRRLKAGILPRHHIDKDKLAKMYSEGVRVEEIAKVCGASVSTVRKYASLSGITRGRYDKVQACRNCWRYPCFKGIENFETNFALTCRSWRLKEKA